MKRDDANQQMLFYVPDPTTSGGGPEGEGEAGEEEEEEEVGHRGLLGRCGNVAELEAL